jgi:Holliday junction resolvase-like predicted endonuclease
MLRLGRRVEKLHIKTPFGELFADIRPQSEERQKSRAAEEAGPYSGSGNAPGSASTPSGMSEFSRAVGSRAGMMKLYYEAEDFVIRILQQEFSTSIAQNVRTGTGIEMDGFFTSENTPHVIEVKLVRSALNSRALLDSLARLVTRLRQEKRFDKVRVIFALVYIEELPQIRQRKFETAVSKVDPTIQIRWFSLSELRQRFVGETENGEGL